jgi:hypothetical protein
MTQKTYSFIGGALLLFGTACGSESVAPSDAATAGGSAGSGGAARTSGGVGGATPEGGAADSGGGATGSGAAGSRDAGVGGSSGSAGAGGSGGGSAGTGGSFDGGGSDVGTGGTAGAGGSNSMNDAAVDRSAPDSGDGGFMDDGGSTNLFPCLPSGEEKLLVEVMGTPPLSIMTPSETKCLSRYLPAEGGSDALLDLLWTGADGSMTVVLRNSQVVPGQTGTFTPFSILLATGAEAWTNSDDKCRVTIAASTKIGEAPQGGGFVQDIYKVAGSMTCSSGWAAPSKPNDELKKFEFATRVSFLRMQ